jgi:hypothetical protein
MGQDWCSTCALREMNRHDQQKTDFQVWNNQYVQPGLWFQIFWWSFPPVTSHQLTLWFRTFLAWLTMVSLRHKLETHWNPRYTSAYTIKDMWKTIGFPRNMICKRWVFHIELLVYGRINLKVELLNVMYPLGN